MKRALECFVKKGESDHLDSETKGESQKGRTLLRDRLNIIQNFARTFLGGTSQTTVAPTVIRVKLKNQ